MKFMQWFFTSTLSTLSHNKNHKKSTAQITANVEKITINKLNKQENKRKTRIMQNFIKENKKGREKMKERKWNCIESECESERTEGKVRIYDK